MLGRGILAALATASAALAGAPSTAGESPAPAADVLMGRWDVDGDGLLDSVFNTGSSIRIQRGNGTSRNYSIDQGTWVLMRAAPLAGTPGLDLVFNIGSAIRVVSDSTTSTRDYHIAGTWTLLDARNTDGRPGDELIVEIPRFITNSFLITTTDHKDVLIVRHESRTTREYDVPALWTYRGAQQLDCVDGLELLFSAGGATVTLNDRLGDVTADGRVESGLFLDSVTPTVVTWGTVTLTLRGQRFTVNTIPNLLIGGSWQVRGVTELSSDTERRVRFIFSSGLFPAGTYQVSLRDAAASLGSNPLEFRIVSGSPQESKVLETTGSLAFGSVNVGEAATRNLTIRNHGNAPMTINGLALPAGYCGGWAGVLAAGASRAIPITFAPTGGGSYNGSVRVESNRTGGNDTVAATGTGVGPAGPPPPSPTPPPPAPTLPGDIDHDGDVDVIWQNRHGGGYLAVWRMDGLTLEDSALLNPPRVTDPNWRIAATADIDGDGALDLIWQEETQGWVGAWKMNGLNLVSSLALTVERVPDTDWKIVAAQDFNHDGKADIVWHHRTQGYLALWYMDGATVVASELFAPGRVTDTNWQIEAAADFSGDGKPDLLWRHQAEGWITVWLMDGLARIGVGDLMPNRVADINWRVAAIGDVNRDNHVDVIWQDTAQGWIGVWLMTGTTLAQSIAFVPERVPDTNWRIVGPK